MLIIDNVLISRELFTNCFCCDLSLCKGICCVEGDAGAPLEEEEIGLIENDLHKIIPFLTPEGKTAIEQFGIFDYDIEGQLTTTLINEKDCVFVYYENGIAKCGIEKAFIEKKIKFQKPISCHLYPIRIKKYPYYEALQYHRWEVCQIATEIGKKKNLSVFEFLQPALTRKYGKKWIEKVKKFVASDNFLKSKNV